MFRGMQFGSESVVLRYFLGLRQAHNAGIPASGISLEAMFLSALSQCTDGAALCCVNGLQPSHLDPNSTSEPGRGRGVQWILSGWVSTSKDDTWVVRHENMNHDVTRLRVLRINIGGLQ